ncbi:MAG TPA: hypothetical protein VEX64_09980, partial [Pyrinomonadaceae bacterium]|nr:hypothetical protein [Pyrinomonadaceae bacterium]
MFACFSQTVTAAVFTVTNADESGAGSLRQAIADADASPGNDEIVFDPAFFNIPRTINLLSELNVAGAGNLTIHGPGVDFLEIINPQTMITSPPRYSFNVSNGQLTLKTIKVRGIIISMSGRAIIERTRFINLGVIN